MKRAGAFLIGVVTAAFVAALWTEPITNGFTQAGHIAASAAIVLVGGGIILAIYAEV